MKQKRCLIAGLPYAGKSTYLGALWYVVNNAANKDAFALKASESNPPEDVEQLAALSRRWMRVEDMERTSTDVPNNICFNLTPKGGGEDFELYVPDFKGESVHQIITGNQPKELDEWCNSSDTLLYMMNEIRPDRFADDYYQDEDEVDKAEELPKVSAVPDFDPKRMPICAQNMLVLRYLTTLNAFSKVVICLTAWDKVMSDNADITPEEYVREESPALYNFIKYHCPNAVFYGLSAQGEEYEYENYEENGEKLKRVTEACRKKLQDATRKGERAFVVEVGKKIKNYDITLPVAELLK